MVESVGEVSDLLATFTELLVYDLQPVQAGCQNRAEGAGLLQLLQGGAGRGRQGSQGQARFIGGGWSARGCRPR